MKKQNDKRRNAFTLLELLVVLVIISLISALVAPRIGGSLTNLELKTGAKRIAAALRYARSKAVSEKKTYAAYFDFDHNRLTISREEQPANISLFDDSAGDSESKEKATEVYDLPNEVSIQATPDAEKNQSPSPYQIQFYPNGSSSGGSVLVANERGNSWTVDVDFITGTTSLSE